MNRSKKFYDFIKFLNKLKEEKRFVGVRGMRGDNSADHSWRLAVLAFLSASFFNIKVDPLKTVKLALVHDIVEILAKDITRLDRIKNNISEETKIKAERKAILKIKKMAPPEIGREVTELWEEYVKKSSKEAKVVASLDKIEGLMTFFERGRPKKFYADYIATYSNEYLEETPELKGLYKELKKEMKASYKKNNIEWKKEYGEI